MLIAEVGINHNGDLGLAKQLIEMAASAGCDVVKFQKRNPEVCVPPSQKNVIMETPFGKMAYQEYRKRMEFGRVEYDIIDNYCRQKKIEWTASVWDRDSASFMLDYGTPFIKIPSAMIVDEGLVRFVAENYDAVMISTGMSTEDEIERCVKWLEGLTLTVMHCVSAYPAGDGDLNLLYIQQLKTKFPHCGIGYSSHDSGIGACIAARALGAEVIEKHITLSREMWGRDQKASIEFDELTLLARELKRVPLWLGRPIKIIAGDELENRRRLRG